MLAGVVPRGPPRGCLVSGVLAVDPGKHACGVACFGLDGELSWARYVDDEEAVRHVASLRDVEYDEAIVELPQVYSLAKSKGGARGQNDLVDVAFAAGLLLGRLGLPRERIAEVRPRMWKGQVPKATMVRRIRGRLSDEEATRVMLPAPSLSHNVFDAVGIGLWRVGRLGR